MHQGSPSMRRPGAPREEARRRPGRRFSPGAEPLEARQLLSADGWRARVAEVAAMVDQTYRTLVGSEPPPEETRHLVRVQAGAGAYAVVANVVGTRAFFERVAGGDPERYVALAAATLDVYPGPDEVARLAAHVEARDGSRHILRAVVARLVPPGSFLPRRPGPPNPLSEQLRRDVLINADYWDETPSILSASLGFTRIIGVPGLGTAGNSEALARRAGGTWQALPEGEAATAPLRALTSATSPRTVALGWGYPATFADGLPVVFSWPVRPSTVSPESFRITLNTGQVVRPLVASISPNLEYNERNTVVLFGDFGNRITPGDPGSIYPVALQVVPGRAPLELVGPGGEIRSAVGLGIGDGQTPMSAYVPGAGPRLVAAKLSVMSTAGEGAPAVFSGALPNDGVALYGEAAQYRLRVLTTGGFSPDGVASVLPTDFSRFFRLRSIDADGVERWLTEAGVEYQLPSGRVTILGLADLGQKQDSYDATYVEDHDNQIDIVLSGDAAAVATIVGVEIPAGGGYSPFYNPGGPGNAPTPGVPYSQPGPSQLQPVTLALEDPMTVTLIGPDPRGLGRRARGS